MAHWTPFDAIVMRSQSNMEKLGYGKTYLEHHPEALPGIYNDPHKYIKNTDIQWAIYSAFHALADCLKVGDTFEFPSGLTVKVEFKPDSSKSID